MSHVITPQPIRGIIVDDEPLSREGLRLRLAEEPDFEVVAEYGSGAPARDGIRRLQPDVVFLDINMPEMDGFRMLSTIDGPRPAVVFLTAHEDHAIRAFAESALDYVLKPASDSRLTVTFNRIRSHVATTREADFGRRVRDLAWQERVERPDPPRRAGASEALPGPAERNPMRPDRAEAESSSPDAKAMASGAKHGSGARLDALRVHERGRILLVRIEQIDWIEACGNYVKLHAGGRTHVGRYSLSRLERRLASRFVRIHRGTLVQRDRIAELQPHFHGDYVAVLRDRTILRVGRTYRDGLLRED